MRHLLDKFQYRGVKSFDFDFHAECSGDNFQMVLDNMVSSIRNNVLNSFGFFITNTATGQAKMQRGVYRTNCLDCLDRTNVV
jgi:G3E family GTPase